MIVTHSPTLHDKQARGFDQTLAKADRQLAAWPRGWPAARPAGPAARSRPRSRRSWAPLAVPGPARHPHRRPPAELRLSWRTDGQARQALEAEYFGKRILFTDHDDWPVAEVVAAYRSQADVEADFRQMKDPHVVSFSPMFHWTDQKIRVHVFYCVLALAVARLMVREAAQAGIDMSVRELLDTLAGIEETVLIYPSAGGRPKARRMLTDIDPAQQHLFDVFGLGAYAPRA